MKNILITASVLAACVGASLPAHAQFDIEESHTTASLRGVDNVGGGVVWASGTGGTVLRSEDGGFLWQTCAIPPEAEKLDFRGVQAFDENTAIVMSSGPGDQSRLYKTTDGCQTWKLLFTNPDKDGFWDAINIIAPSQDPLGRPLDHSYAWGSLLGDPVNGNFTLFSTLDGGTTWTRITKEDRGHKGEGCKVDPFVAHDQESAFAASNQSLVSLNGSYLFFVTGGLVARLAYTGHFDMDGSFCYDSAHFKQLPIAHGNPSSGAFAVAAVPFEGKAQNFPDKIMIVGGDYKLPDSTDHSAVLVRQPGTIFQTLTEPKTPPHGYRSSVAFDTQQKLWITVGPNGTDISRDDGRNWQPLRPSPGDPADADKNWNALSLPFVVGPHGRIGRLRTIVPDAKQAARSKS